MVVLGSVTSEGFSSLSHSMIPRFGKGRVWLAVPSQRCRAGGSCPRKVTWGQGRAEPCQPRGQKRARHHLQDVPRSKAAPQKVVRAGSWRRRRKNPGASPGAAPAPSFRAICKQTGEDERLMPGSPGSRSSPSPGIRGSDNSLFPPHLSPSFSGAIRGENSGRLPARRCDSPADLSLH